MGPLQITACRFLLALVTLITLRTDCNEAAGPTQSLRTLATQGIVVPKRSALISGLNQQFKLKLPEKNGNHSSTSGSLLAPIPSLSQPSITISKPAAGSLFDHAAHIHWLSSRNHNRRNQQQQQQLGNQNSISNHNGQQTLYLDRHQQEILAANPNLLNPSNLPSTLLTRSDYVQAPSNSATSLDLSNNRYALQAGTNLSQSLRATNPRDQQQQGLLDQQVGGNNGQQQTYRGFSLIELEIKSDSDKRYVQDLYGNLTAAVNEQAQNPNALGVSPYVDVDFWSFKYALNDHIDVMVSPKSRPFILGQLSRAKIRHRIKIDDIQSRLDQQLPNSSGGAMMMLPPLDRSSPETLSGRGGGGATGADKREMNLNARQAPDGSTVGGSSNGEQTSGSRPLNETQFFDNYQRLADINQYLEDIVERNRDVAQVKVIGRSSQGRYLRVLKLGYDQQDVDGLTSARFVSDNSGRQPVALNNASYILENFFRKQESVQKLGAIWLDGGTHAREWISPSTVMFIANRLSGNHNRCLKFFDTLRLAVSQANAASQQQRAARRYTHSQPGPTNLEPDLISGINEINTSLLGKPVQKVRPRTELEQTLELLAKNPQVVAEEFGCDLSLEQLLRRYTFYMMPVLNPDGYEYSHTHNRLWRKTRSTSNHPIYRHFCLGADPNRNYDARHGATGSSTHPCSQTYAGTVPFTEPETRHQSNFVYANRLGIKMFISFHSYSQMILLPFSHSKQLAPDHKDLESVGQAAVKAIEQTHGTVYRVGPSASILYTASGTASDWAYEKAGIKYSYTIELRDTGTYGFLLPRQQIVPTGEETFNGLLAMIGQMEKNDRLLTSKSSVLLASNTQTEANLTLPITTPDYTHVPDAEQLSSVVKNRSRPQLENVLSGSSSWKSQDASQAGVRDRKPVVPNSTNTFDMVNDQSTTLIPDTFPLANRNPIRGEAPSLADTGLTKLDDEPTGDSSDNELDAGYAFEGEGELMEPTRENIVEASKLTELKLSGRRDHTRRVVLAAGLTVGGRNFINSPLLKGREEPVLPKRESAESLSAERKLKIVA